MTTKYIYHVRSNGSLVSRYILLDETDKYYIIDYNSFRNVYGLNIPLHGHKDGKIKKDEDCYFSKEKALYKALTINRGELSYYERRVYDLEEKLGFNYEYSEEANAWY